MNQFIRSEIIIGKDNIQNLSNKTVCVLGVGGVGGAVVEGLVRSGIGKIIIVDNDTIVLSNLNRQIISLSSNIGQSKVEVAKRRVLDINPKCICIGHDAFICKENISSIISEDVDFVVDAIDTVTSKLDVIEYCKNNSISVVSSMGTGNKIDPTKFKIVDISKTKVCPLAKVMRYELKKRDIKGVPVLFSDEIPLKPILGTDSSNKRQTPGSMSFVPPVAGYILAGYVVNSLRMTP